MKKQLQLAAYGSIAAVVLLTNSLCIRSAVGQTAVGQTIESAVHFKPDGLASELFHVGLEVSVGVRQTIAEPRLVIVQELSQRRQVLQQLSARHGWDRFSRNSVMAPVHVEIQSINDSDGNRIGHHLYSAFVAYLDLSLIEERDWMESLFRAERDNQDGQASSAILPQEIPEALLTQLGLHPSDISSDKFRVIDLPLLNRISIRGVIQFEVLRSEESLLFAWKLDPRFTPSSLNEFERSQWPFINHYAKLDRDDLGRLRESPPVSYGGMGGYMSICPTGLEPDQHLVETRMLLHEPDEWFSGSNFLRSKFPTLLQESGQTFRRKLNR